MAGKVTKAAESWFGPSAICLSQRWVRAHTSVASWGDLPASLVRSHVAVAADPSDL